MSEAAQKITDFLIKERGYGKQSILVERVETEIQAMANRIAEEVIAENPELAGVIRNHVRRVVSRVLRDDAYLNSVVTNAVAKGLGQLVDEARHDET